MEQQVKPFINFLPGSHLILGEAGSGKTRLICSLLQSKNFYEENSVNIVLTDSEKRIWSKPAENPVTTIDPFSTDISWITDPTKPGIYYCACNYAPRLITFLECLATWARQNEEKIQNSIKVFIDYPVQLLMLPEFIEQLTRLHYISETLNNNDSHPIDIWTVLGTHKDISPKAKLLFKNSNLILVNPFPDRWNNYLSELQKEKSEQLKTQLPQINQTLKDGFYYFPYNDNSFYLQDKPVE
ncbi:MAG: hypothetical protein WCR27_00105 [Eubacteriales bacterium]